MVFSRVFDGSITGWILFFLVNITMLLLLYRNKILSILYHFVNLVNRNQEELEGGIQRRILYPLLPQSAVANCSLVR